MEKPLFHINHSAYVTLLLGLTDLPATERKGNLSDFQPYTDGQWLVDTAIIEHLAYSKGE